MNYYIADMHFGHRKCLEFDSRPFNNVEEMNEELVRLWNGKVNDNDDVWIIGDFCYRSDKDPSFFLKQLKGKKHFVVGNHDKVTLKSASAKYYLESIDYICRIVDGGRDVVLCHYPIADWSGKRRGVVHIYGHIHANRDDVSAFMFAQEKAFNAGCMLNRYVPVSLDELIKNKKTAYAKVLEKQLDEAKAEEFDKQFPYKEKLRLPGQLV